jgi:histidine ammonia-lyase
VRVEFVCALVAALNAGVHPIVFQGGSVGQADLSEMAQIGRALLGLGEAEYGGRRYAGAAALAAAGLAPLQLKPKEALGLISANGVTLGHGSLVLEEVADLLATFDLAAALALEGFGANVSIIHPAAARLKGHAGQRRVADRLRALLRDSYLWQESSARNLQDPLSFRCVPQTHGACADAHDYVRRMLEAELNAAGDNPLVSVEDDAVISVGNFDITGIAVAFDMLRIALAQVIQLANERVQKQLWSHFSDLPAGLRLRDEPVGGLYPLARMCASLAAEAQVLAGPVSLAYRAQIGEGIEDHASMAPLGIRQTARLVQVGWRLAALELIVAARAIDLRGKPALGRGTRIAYDAVRLRAPLDTAAGEFNVERVAVAVAGGALIEAVRDIIDDRLASGYPAGPTVNGHGSTTAPAGADDHVPTHIGYGPWLHRDGPHPGGLVGARARDRQGVEDALLSATA